MTKILITGGCGFIGANFAEFLLEKTDWDINILDNLSTGNIGSITEINGYSDRIIIFKGDITNSNDIEDCIRDCDYVVNLAAQTSVINSIEDPFYDEKVNILGILNLLHSSVKYRVKKFIHASSSAAVGEQEMPMNESKIPKPISPYGASKLAGEAYCSAFSRSFGLNCVVLRFSNVFGPKSIKKRSVIAKFIKKIIREENLEIYGDGNQTRDFVYVKDICSGIYLSLIKEIADFNLFQLGSGIETSINSLINKLKELLKKQYLKIFEIKFYEQRPGEIIYSYSDISKVKKKLGFSINYDLDKGLQETFKWFSKNFI